MIKPEVKLKAILEITRNLSSELKIDAVAPKILDSLMELFPQAERLFLILVDPHQATDPQGVQAPAGQEAPFTTAFPADEVPMSISRSIVNHVLLQKKAVLSQDAGADKNLPDQRLDRRSQDPLGDVRAAGHARQGSRGHHSARYQRPQAIRPGRPRRAGRRRQPGRDLDPERPDARIVARARATDRDLKLAEQVQKRFLPQSVPVIPGLRVLRPLRPGLRGRRRLLRLRAAAGRQAGDRRRRRLGQGGCGRAHDGQVFGRHSLLHPHRELAVSGRQRAQHLLFSAGIEEKFITLSLCVLDLGKRTLAITSAGHLPILIRRAGGKVEEIGEEIAGFPLGIVPGSDYQQSEVSLNTGDVVVVFSDGVTDARNLREELYDSRENSRLLRQVAETAGGPETVGRAILQDIREFSADHVQVDDITLICFGPVAPAASRPATA